MSRVDGSAFSPCRTCQPSVSRHDDVEGDRARLELAGEPQALGAVGGADHPVARIRQVLLEQQDDVRVVVDRKYQPAATRSHLARDRLELFGGRGGDRLLLRRARQDAAISDRQAEREAGTRTRLALQRDIAAQEPREPPADRQPEPRAAILPGAAAVHLAEFLEHQLQLIQGNADAGVRDRDGDVLVAAPHIDGDRARLGEFGGVAQEIDQDLAQLVLVAEQGRQSPLDLLDQLHAPAPDHRLDGAQALVEERLEHELERPHVHASGLDLGQVEHVVDQPEQMVGAGQDLLEIAVLALGQEILAAAHDQPGEADDRVHRRPQLVAHVGQELGLRPARLLGLLLGRLQRLLGALEVGQIVVGQHAPAVGQRHAPVLEHAAVGKPPLGGEGAGAGCTSSSRGST